MGADGLVYAREPASGAALIARTAPDAVRRLERGAAVRLAADPARVLVFGEDGRRVPARPVEGTPVAKVAHVA